MNLDPTLLQRYATALGDNAIESLAERELIRSVDTPTFDPIEVGLLADRVAGTVAGLTLGDAFASRFREDGMVATYAGLDRTVRQWRGKQRHERRRDGDRFWGDHKEAEEL
jgi:hypothetical protein